MHLITYRFKLKPGKTCYDFEVCLKPFRTVQIAHGMIHHSIRPGEKPNTVIHQFFATNLKFWQRYSKGVKARELALFLNDIVESAGMALKIRPLLPKTFPLGKIFCN